MATSLTTDLPAVQTRLAAFRASLHAATIGRVEEIDMLLIALIARQHALFVGSPGTGKSFMCRLLADGVQDARYCERLLSPTTPPEAVWGPISLAALREDKYQHITEGYAADSHVLYLDEVGRASPAILDSLLHLLGPERQALIGTVNIKAPLVSAIGSANTWPEDAAMLDRWLMRMVVRPLSPSNQDALAWADLPGVSPVVTLSDLADANEASKALLIDPDTKARYAEIRGALVEAGIKPSDRRVRMGVSVARAAAILDGATSVLPRHLEILATVLWDQPGQIDNATDIVLKIANPVGARLMSILRETDEIVGTVKDTTSRLQAIAKLEDMKKELKQTVASGNGNGRALAIQKHVQREWLVLQAAALGVPVEKAEALYASL